MSYFMKCWHRAQSYLEAPLFDVPWVTKNMTNEDMYIGTVQDKMNIQYDAFRFCVIIICELIVHICYSMEWMLQSINFEVEEKLVWFIEYWDWEIGFDLIIVFL